MLLQPIGLSATSLVPPVARVALCHVTSVAQHCHCVVELDVVELALVVYNQM